MMTIIKWAVFAALLFVVYAIGMNAYEGKIDENSTINEVKQEVNEEAKDVVKSVEDAVK